MRIPSGNTDKYIYFVAVDSADFTTRETGLSSFTVYRSRDGGVAAAMTTPTINETDSTNMPGVYELLVDEDTTIAAGHDSEEMILHIEATGMAPVSRTIELYRPKITEGNTLAVNASSQANALLVDGAHGGSAATLTLERIIVASTTAGEPAMKLTGNTSGAGLSANGGTSGDGIEAKGGATSGIGMDIIAGGSVSAALKIASTEGPAVDIDSTLADGISIYAGGGDGITAYGEYNGIVAAANTEIGLKITSTVGHAATITTSGTNKHGIQITGTGTGNAVELVTGSGAGINAPDGINNVILADGAHGGAAAVLTLERIVVLSTTNNEPAIKVTGASAGASAALAIAGLTGPGLDLTSVSSVSAQAPDGITADITGTIDTVTDVTNGVDVAKINSSTAAAVRLALSAGEMYVGTVDNTGHAPTTTEFEADDITEATDDHFNGRIIIFTSGTLKGQATDITDYTLTGGRGHFTTTALTEAPGNNDTFIII